MMISSNYKVTRVATFGGSGENPLGIFAAWLNQKVCVTRWTSTEPNSSKGICVGQGQFSKIKTTNASGRLLHYLENFILSYNNRIS